MSELPTPSTIAEDLADAATHAWKGRNWSEISWPQAVADAVLGLLGVEPDTLTDAVRDAIAGCDDRDRLRAGLEKVIELHHERSDNCGYCEECDRRFPCETHRAALAALEEETDGSE